MIDFSLSDAQRALQRVARDYVSEVLEPRDDLDAHGGAPFVVFEEAWSRGLLTAMLPADIGGGGHRPLDLAPAVEEVAYGDVGVATSIFVTTLGTGPLVLFGTPDQQARWLRPLAEAPGLCAFGWTEPEGSSNLIGRGASTTARRVPGGYRVRGVKSTITNAPVASFVTVFVRVDAPDSPQGLTALVVSTEAEGVEQAPPYRKHGQRASPLGQITFHDVFVPVGDRIGAEGQGLAIATRAFTRSRAGIGALSVGVARRARDLAIAFGHERRAGNGRPLAEQQDYALRIAQIEAELTAARALTWRALWEIDNGPAAVRLASCAKLVGADMAVRVTDQVCEMLGAQGYLEGPLAEKLRRDAKALQIYEGPPTIQRILIAETATRRGRMGRP